ncbi:MULTISPECIES: hypothetical protein [unclassified Psychrobacillus]|uniref:hypothetical protein n=1 Tax=unclassified Psychrobacillus TaxID=2636677 RepID=UPI0030F8B9EC
MKESDMFQPVKDLLHQKLGCAHVYAEVGVYDVVGLLENVNIIVEMKKQMSFKVIEQARRAAGLADYVFVAIPKPKASINSMAVSLLKQEGIGLILVGVRGAKIQFWGRRHRRKGGKGIRSQIRSHHKETIGGVKSGEGPTEYSVTIEKIKDYLQRKDWVTVDDIVVNVETHYKNPRASIGTTLKASWNASWCERKKEGRKTYFRLIQDKHKN